MLKPKFFLMRLNDDEFKEMEKVKEKAKREKRSASNYIKSKIFKK